MLLDGDGIGRQLGDLGIVERVAVAQFNWHVDRAHRAAGLGLAGKFHLDQLGTDVAADDGQFTGSQHGLVHVELVRIDRALHHGLSQPVARGDEHHLLKAGFGVDGEHHTSRAEIGAHHALNAGGQRYLGMRKSLVHAVRDRTVVVQRGEHVLDRLEHIVDPDHVEKGLLLAGEGRIRQVFSGRGGADSE